MATTTCTRTVHALRVPIALAVALALSVGPTSSSSASATPKDRRAERASASTAPLWDAQKLEAMAGRMQYPLLTVCT